MVKYQCDKCGLVSDSKVGTERPEGWGFPHAYDLCPECLRGFTEFRNAIFEKRDHQMKAWFKEIK